MITCPNCNHQNPDGAQQCEACYTPLPAMVACPSCGTPVQENASFCGQCGHDLRSLKRGAAPGQSGTSTPDLTPPDVSAGLSESSIPTENLLGKTATEPAAAEPAASPASGAGVELPDLITPDPLVTPEPISPVPDASEPPEVPAPMAATPASTPAATQLQVLTVRLRHAQTDTVIEIPRQLSVVRIGKPNDQTPPDIDVSGFSDSEVVSRVHASLRVEGDVYYLEDVGSSNGTYVNGLPLVVGNRHRLRAGDRIALGKGDKVSFIFETA
ncbi:MAG: FHA domain-containing protein [Cyanobacteria bacterium P01_D01_bin.105]